MILICMPGLLVFGQKVQKRYNVKNNNSKSSKCTVKN